jgi:hypothetical protein
MKYNEEINGKVLANAKSSYFMPLANLAFLFSQDKNINHPFVRSHVKTANFIHLLFLFNYVLFIHFSFLWSISFFNYNLNNIIASIIFMILFWLLLFGLQKAHKWEVFGISDILKIGGSEKIIAIDKKENIDEEGKITIILSSIPLVGIIVYGKNYKDILIENINKFNLMISFIISLVYVLWNREVANIFFLIYIIFIVFSAMMIFTQDEIIHINMAKIWSPTKIYDFLKDWALYMKLYFSKEKFKDFESLRKDQEEKRKAKDEKEIIFISEQKNFSINEKIIYIPLINIVFLIKLHTKKYFHIINGFWFSLVLILSWVIFWIYNFYQLLLIFPLLYGISFLNSKENYKIPVIFDTWNMIISILKRVKSLFIKTKEIKKKEEVVSLKVEQ